MVAPGNDLPRGGWAAWLGPGPEGEGPRPRLGVSACLLGENVRYDRGHARDRFVAERLSPWVEWVRVCPEVEAGFGVPRPTMRLVDEEGEQRLVVPSTGEDVTERMRASVGPRVEALVALELDGFVVKKDSPSCGLQRVRVYGPHGVRHKQGIGLFTRALLERLPELPVEEEGRLNDPWLRDWFLERVWCRNRWRRLRAAGIDRAGLVRFHTAHKFLVRAHDEVAYRELGRIVSSFGRRPDEEVHDEYGRLFARALARPASRGRHANVLQHLLGFFKDELGAEEKRHLLARIDEYRRGVVPLIVPLAMLRFEAERRGKAWARAQLWFDSHPRELDGSTRT